MSGEVGPALGAGGWREVDLAAERGVWGKVHGAASDYRWIAASAGMPAGGFGRQLYLGSEDLQESCFLWRSLGDGSFLAIAVRPSRASDAAGRSGFLERHVLLLRPSGGESVALLALAAAAVVADWPRLPEAPAATWRDPDFRLPLAPARGRRSGAELAALAAAGRRALAAGVSPAALAASYAGLLAGRRPTFLGAAPLPAGAVAALLLPLPESLAEGLSIAGGLPSSRYREAELGQVWDLVATATPPAGWPPEAASERAGRLAAALLDGSPVAAEETLGDEPAAAESAEGSADPPWLAVVERFLADPAWRWLSPVELPRLTLLEEKEARRLAGWAEDFAARPAPAGADREHWQVKQEVVAALLLATAPGEVLQRFRPGRRVPALLFAGRLAGGDWRRLRERLGRRFEELARQSLACAVAARSFDRSRLADLLP